MRFNSKDEGDIADADAADAKKVSAADLIPVGRDEIIIMSPLPADFYVRLSETNFILVGRRGDAKLQDLHAIKDFRVGDLFVRRDEYKNCIGINLQIAEVAISKSELSDLKKVDFLFKASDGVFREIEKIGFNHESLEHSKVVANSIVTLAAAKNDIHGVLEIMASVSDELVRHSMAVTVVSIMIAKEMNWTKQSTIQKLALAALLHDIGLKEIPKELLDRPRHLMSLAEVKDYESHVMRGVEILRSMPNVGVEVVAVAMEHHENAIGQGYPRHLRDIKMNPFAKVVALADAFCELTLSGTNNANARSADEAIKFIEITLGQPYSKPAFQALKQTLSLDIRRKTSTGRRAA